MFKFNFQISEDLAKPTDEYKSNSFKETDIGLHRQTTNYNAVNWRHFKVHGIESYHLEATKNTQFEEINLDESKNLKYIITDAVNKNIQDVCAKDQQHLDLIPAIYEGGFKIWECTWDILELIKERKSEFNGKRVLELGCGAGIPGIAAAFYGASYVAFQDYNEEVINRLTIPNVILNFPNAALNRCEDSQLQFYSGDWGNLIEGILSDSVLTSSTAAEVEDKLQFDIILTSETIYNPYNHSKLVNVFNRCLKSNGIAFVAAKNYYFGVGGGTHDFIRAVSEQKNFKVSTKVCHNKDVLREIIEIVKD